MSATPKPVVGLFDVDETLMHTGGSGARSWQFVFQKIHGIPATTCAHNSTGETDPQVARAIVKGVLGRDPSDGYLDLHRGLMPGQVVVVVRHHMASR
jgi:hypothetical protein